MDMRTRVEINDRVEAFYEHVPIIASANPITGTKYLTKVWLGNYLIGEVDEKLDDEQVKARVIELMQVNQERQYGTQRTLLRRDLPRRSQLGQTSRGITGSILS